MSTRADNARFRPGRDMGRQVIRMGPIRELKDLKPAFSH
jgi:hypothetical protein